MSKLLVVSNRLPITVRKRGDKINIQSSAGGLATGMASLPDADKKYWIGWPGIASDDLSAEDKEKIAQELIAKNYNPLFLSQREVDDYYYGFCNKTIWPLFHYFPLYTVYENQYWETYKEVNEAFCGEVMKLVGPEDRIWIHDYQLMLLPALVREKIPEAQIGFFLHIPFPSYELFRLLPWRTEIIRGLLGADLIGFHTYDYVHHFLSSACRLRDVEHTLGQLSVENRIVKVDAFPMGINYEKYSRAVSNPHVQRATAKFRKKVGDCKIILSVDRLDYTKGIVQRLEAFNLFLAENPEYKGKVTLILLAVPSRTAVDDYAALREQVEGLVGRINGEHGVIGWLPVWYLYRAVPFERLMALYDVADIALVTPLRDGMNLVAKEFVAAKTSGKGVLILSEMAGAASELGEALIVNSNDRKSIVKAIKEALSMTSEEQVRRNKLMQARISRYNVFRWAIDFINALAEIKEKQEELSVRKLRGLIRQNLLREYSTARKRLILLDYDGTLVGFVKDPAKAEPDDEICRVLRDLSKDPGNEVVVISGRDTATLTQWLGGCGVHLVAEHGAWVKEKQQHWRLIEPLNNEWKNIIRPILELYVDRTPGSFVEEKDYALVWHYRGADRELAYVRTQEIRQAVIEMTTNLDVGAFEGNKILEVKNIAVNKGRITEFWLARDHWDFVLGIGDDYTDEDMFSALPEQAYSIKVGPGISKAHFSLDSVTEVRLLLREFVR